MNEFDITAAAATAAVEGAALEALAHHGNDLLTAIKCLHGAREAAARAEAPEVTL